MYFFFSQTLSVHAHAVQSNLQERSIEGPPVSFNSNRMLPRCNESIHRFSTSEISFST